MKFTSIILCITTAAVGFTSAAVVTVGDKDTTEINPHYNKDREGPMLVARKRNPHCECYFGCTSDETGPAVQKRKCLSAPTVGGKVRRITGDSDDDDYDSEVVSAEDASAAGLKVYGFGEEMPDY